MGGGIAQSLALAGNDVWLADADKESTQRNYERLLKESELFEAQGLFAQGSTEVLKQKFHPADSIEEAVADVHFVEEAVFGTRRSRRTSSRASRRP